MVRSFTPTPHGCPSSQNQHDKVIEDCSKCTAAAHHNTARHEFVLELIVPKS